MDMHNSKILLVGDSSNNEIAAKTARILNDNNIDLSTTADMSRIADDSINIAFITEEDQNKISQLKLSLPFAEIIVISDTIDPELIDNDMIYGCLQNDYTAPELLLKLKSALKHNRLRQQVGQYRENIAMTFSFDNFVGSSKPIQKIKETIKKISATEIPVHISGARGTGKDLVAHIIHHHSENRKSRLVEIDCDQTSEQLLEIDLFGHNSQAGKISEANGGTLYLKNIDKMPLETQKKFYEFCQTFKLGSEKIELRLISSATNDINNMIKKQLFLEELFYQLAVIPIHLPTLAKRNEDISELAESLLRKINYDHLTKVTSISRDALELLLNHNWPGNIAELEGTIKRATQIAHGSEIKADDIIITGQKQKAFDSEPSTELIIKGKTGLMDEGQKTLIIKTLNNNNWNYSQTAEELGIGRTTLWRKVKKYNLKQETIS